MVMGICSLFSHPAGTAGAGDEAASFTKEEMQQGKHTDYERLLHEQLFICHNHKEGRYRNASRFELDFRDFKDDLNSRHPLRLYNSRTNLPSEQTPEKSYLERFGEYQIVFRILGDTEHLRH